MAESNADKIITKDLVREGIWHGIINFEKENGSDLICVIGEYRFYFDIVGSRTYPSLTVYLLSGSMSGLVKRVYDALEAMRTDGDEPSTEYLYYYWYLKERLNRIWKEEGYCSELASTPESSTQTTTINSIESTSVPFASIQLLTKIPEFLKPRIDKLLKD